MRFYAVYRPYGLHVLNRDGRQANALHAFASRTERDRYAQDMEGKAEALPASSPLVRRVLRQNRAQLWWSGKSPDTLTIHFLDD